MEKLIKRSYKALQKRGCITNKTTIDEFLEKITEEFDEAYTANEHINHDLYKYQMKYFKLYIEEMVDLATVCIMSIHHLGYDFIEEFEKCVIKNEKRAKNS